ncbi:hypothetical protein C8Q75DRAFT_744838 [Abortiporus biennis]|nr:hypothetical protein C8Q75DRAFT_744838 [Abortiporus biennis]
MSAKASRHRLEPGSQLDDEAVRRSKRNVAQANKSTWQTFFFETEVGALKEMSSMPIDILAEIFQHMESEDLLNLSRSSISFRLLLTSQTSQIFWRVALKKTETEFPPMPVNLMNELQWTNLLFSSHCHECCVPGAEDIIWVYRARYCDDCKNKIILPLEPVPEKSEMFEFLPKMTEKKKQVPNLALLTIHHLRNRESFNLNELNLLKQELEGLEGNDREEFIANRIALVKQNTQFGKDCAAFLRNNHIMEEKKRQRLQSRRMKTIKDGLRDMGYGPELDGPYGFSMNSMLYLDHNARLPKVLTPDEWDVIKVRYQELFEKLREETRTLEYARKLGKNLSILKYTPIRFSHKIEGTFPCPKDFFRLPEIRAILDVPPDQSTVTTEREFLKTYSPQIQGFIDNWRSSSKQLLGTIARNAAPYIPKEVNPLDLAVGMFFVCTCDKSVVMTLPDLLHHGCTLKPNPGPRKPYNDKNQNLKDPYLSVLLGSGPECEDTLDIKSTFHSAAEFAKHVIEVCRKDPCTVTAEEMDKLDTRFVCFDCAMGGFQVRPIMTWRRTIVHMACEWKPRKFPVIHNVHLALKFEIEQTKALEESIKLGSWLCLHCKKWDEYHPTTKSIIIEHLREHHNIKPENAVRSRDYVANKPFEATTAKPTVWLISSKLAKSSALREERHHHVICDLPEKFA